ncbi:MAG TPA: PilX N-terminal domain-containing pilus assembly protein [Azonexus sp.]|nr:PilX N-terminal domain-containing pilus assembly protein [Azonexus sp.]
MPAQQGGIALIMAIIMLIVATLAGIAGIRGSSLQEKLSGNLYDRAIALQAAEAALKAAELRIVSTDRANLLKDSKIVDCTQAATSCPPIPTNAFNNDANGWTALATTTNSSLKADTFPQYFIQYLGLKNSNAVTDTSQSAIPLQYGATGGGSGSDSPQNATYRVIARSSQPTTSNDRSIALVSSLIKGN